jgi:hypothetical protein
MYSLPIKFALTTNREHSEPSRAPQRCEQHGEFAIAELVRKLLVEEQDHQIDPATRAAIDRLDPSAR